MGNSYIYLILVLVLFMFLIRFLFPILVFLIPVFLVMYVVKSIMRSRKQTKTTYQQTHYDQPNNTNQTSDPNVFDVDYKVVDEEEQDNTQ